MAEFENNNEELEVDIITLTDEESGEEQDFELYARAIIDDKLYYALIPVTDAEETEYVILRATEDGDDILFETIEDDDEFDKVADHFDDMLFNDVDYDEN